MSRGYLAGSQFEDVGVGRFLKADVRKYCVMCHEARRYESQYNIAGLQRLYLAAPVVPWHSCR